ncbi:MAG: ATP-binding protein [Candidatus Margulisbacteria bacterium]|nr:ATP-binding protein [Candidatus Margulisiibacteriota bacterium]
MIANLIEFSRELEKVNEWWLTKAVIEEELYPFKRALFSKLTDALPGRRIMLLLGPRRTGKSVLLKQMIASLLSSGIEPASILYYSLDDPSLAAYSDNLIKDLIDYHAENIVSGKKRYIFLDEVQSFPGWHKWIKTFYDRNPSIKFILSGSASITLQNEANQFLRGRTFELSLFPLDLNEFLALSGQRQSYSSLEDLLKLTPIEISTMGKKIMPLFKEYALVGGFPEWFQAKPFGIEAWFNSLISDVPKKSIYEDIAKLYGIKSPRMLELILTFIISHQSQILAYETINEAVGLDRATLVNYIEFLKSSYLLIDILKFAKIKEQLKAKKKFLAVDQGLRNAILKDYKIQEENIGFIIENMVGIKCSQAAGQGVYYWRNNGEIDFILKGQAVSPLEVKYKNQIKKEDLSSILFFLNKMKLPKGMVITKDLFQKKTIDNKQIIFVPAWLFLLAE